VRHVLGGLLGELALVDVDGRPITCMTNVTDRPDEVIVTLINNSPDLAWEGRVRFRGAGIGSFEAWLGHSEAGLKNGVLSCGVPANDVRVFRLLADRPVLDLRHEKVDWQGLGFGVPEVDLEACPGRQRSHF